MPEIRRLGGDILASERFDRARRLPHHYDYSIAAHSLEAAQFALLICDWCERQGFSVSKEDAVRAALLHDLGMTEPEVFSEKPVIKCRTHPIEGCRIAKKEFGANPSQLNAIYPHMWPVGPVPPPFTRTGWILSVADKLSSVRETWNHMKKKLKRNPKRRIRRRK